MVGQDPLPKQKILAIKLRAIGDTVIWTASLQALREAFPQAEIHTLTYGSNAPILQGNPVVNVRHYVNGRGRMEMAKKLWALRAEKFTWALGFHATTSLCRWAWLVGAKRLALHHHSWTHTPRGSVEIPHPGRLEEVIARDFRVLEAMLAAESGAGAGERPGRALEKRPPPRLYLTPEESETAEREVRAEISRCGGDIHLPRFLFMPGASQHLRRYPKDLWLPLAEKCKRERHFQPLVMADQGLSRELDLPRECQRLGLPLIDRGGLREFMGLVSRGTKALVNDSAPGHIAVAFGVRTITVFGPGCVGDFHPYDRKVNPVFQVAVPCRSQGPRDQPDFQYCTVTECSHHRCMREVRVELGL